MLRISRASSSSQESIPATNASRMIRSICARAACSTWSCTALNASKGDISLDLPCRPARDRRHHVLLTVLEHLDLGAAVEEAALFLVVLAGVDDRLHDRLRRSAFQHPLAGEVGGEPHPLDGAHALDVVGVGGQQLLGHQLREHMVVTFERGEHIGVGLERDEAVLGEITCAAAGFAGLLDRAGRMPGVGRLETSCAGLQLALFLGVGALRRLQLVALGDEFVLRELQCIGLAINGNNRR